jgi:hypothetical protein
MEIFEQITKFIDENPEYAEAASNAILQVPTFPSAPDTPYHDIFFVDYINYSAFDDPTTELVVGSSANPSPESSFDQDHPHQGRAGPSPQIPSTKPDDTCEYIHPVMWRDTGDKMFYQARGRELEWKWGGQMGAPDQPWTISTSNVETPTPAHIPTSSTPVDTKSSGKRVRDDDADAPTPGVSGAPSLKRVKPDWEGVPGPKDH